MSMILLVPSIFAASGVAWLITRRTGPLRWWYWVAPVQVVVNLLWNGVLAGDTGLSDEVAGPLASVLALLTIAVMSAGLRLARRGQRPHDDPRSRDIIRATRRQALVALAVSGIGAISIMARYQRESRELDTLRDRAMTSLDAYALSRASSLDDRQVDAWIELAKSEVTPRGAWNVAADRTAELELLKASFIVLMSAEVPRLDAGPGVADTLSFAENIHFELTDTLEGIPLVGRGDIYLTDRGALYLLRLADRASHASPRSAVSRAVSRIEAILPENVDAVPDRYIDLDKSWRRVTDPVWPRGAVMYIRIARHRSRVECGVVIAMYLDRVRYLDLIGSGR